MKPSLFYFYDALCGWCYGFSPVVQRLFEHFGDRIDFQVFSGGMVRGERAGPIGEAAPYIRTAYKTVEDRTGVTFGEPFLARLEEGSSLFTSLPPAIAMAVFRQEKPHRTIPFAGALHRAVYVDGIEPTRHEAYGPYVEPFGLDPASFVARMDDPVFRRTAEQEFAECERLGISGFPTLILHDRGKNFLLAKGYTPYEPLAAFLEERLGQPSGPAT